MYGTAANFTGQGKKGGRMSEFGNLHQRVDRIMNKLKNRVHCASGISMGGRAYLLCGVRHQGMLQAFSVNSFLKLDRTKQCTKCLRKLENRTSE
jgi:hypothetical protein